MDFIFDYPLLIIVLVIYVLFKIYSKIDDIRTSRYNRRMAEELSPVLKKVAESVNAGKIAELEEQIKSLEDVFKDGMVILEDDSGNPINVCPYCGDTLSAKTVNWYGRILGCPNYPKCRYLVKVKEIKSGMIFDIKVKNILRRGVL